MRESYGLAHGPESCCGPILSVWGHDMRLIKLVTAATLVAAFGVTAPSAQAQNSQPAEFPPSSFKGKQYVDSQGCVFIRAGIDGNVSWIPRMTRARKPICGFAPSLGSQTASAAAAASAPAEKPVQITVNTTTTAAAAPAPAPAPKPTPRVVRRQTAPAPVRQVAPKPVRRPAPVAVAVAPAPTPAPVPAPTARVATTGASACAGVSAVSQRYLRNTRGAPVRCGPQAHRIVPSTRVASQQAAPVRVTTAAPQVVRPAAVAPTASVTGQTRVVPRHVAVNRINTTNVRVPHGYKRVWEDDRLNPKRAEQTLGGRSQMLLMWTNTLPRRLINQTNGRDVTASVPLVYPYLDVATQSRELGEVQIVQRDGQTVKRIVRNPGAARVTYSSRSAPKPQTAATAKPARVQPKAAKPAAATGPARYVQIGLFSTKAKAQQAARHLSGMGMGARMGTVRRGGKTYTAVQAGPFRGNAATDRAVRRLRGVGYSGAAVR